jgi:hypothetical protein
MEIANNHSRIWQIVEYSIYVLQSALVVTQFIAKELNNLTLFYLTKATPTALLLLLVLVVWKRTLNF